MSMEIRSAIDFYERHPISSEIILAKLSASRGHLNDVAPEELFPHDQDHYGGLEANDTLAARAAIGKGTRVVDFCAGLGGPSRYLAHRYGADVTGIELTPARVKAYEARKYGISTSEYRQREQETKRCGPIWDSKWETCAQALLWGLSESVYLERKDELGRGNRASCLLTFEEAIRKVPRKLHGDDPVTLRLETCTRNIMLGRWRFRTPSLRRHRRMVANSAVARTSAFGAHGPKWHLIGSRIFGRTEPATARTRPVVALIQSVFLAIYSATIWMRTARQSG